MEKKMRKILVIENRQSWINRITNALQDDVYMIEATTNPQEGIIKSRKTKYDLILLDYALKPLKSPDVLCEILINNQDRKVVILTLNQNVKEAANYMRLGAFDYRQKVKDKKEIKKMVEEELAAVKTS